MVEVYDNKQTRKTEGETQVFTWIYFCGSVQPHKKKGRKVVGDAGTRQLTLTSARMCETLKSFNAPISPQLNARKELASSSAVFWFGYCSLTLPLLRCDAWMAFSQ